MSIVSYVPPVSFTQFGHLFARLATALRSTDTDPAVVQVYYDALKSCDVNAMAGAVAFFTTEPGRRYMPTTAEWHERATVLSREASLRAVVHHRDDPWRVECATCEDTGWQIGPTCDGGSECWPEQREPKTNLGPAVGKLHHRPVGSRPPMRATAQPRASTCGRVKPHDPHDYTQVCPCRATNHTYQRTHAFGRTASQ